MRRADLGAGLFVAALGALALWGAFAIPASPLYAQVGPKAVPFAVAAGLLGLGALLAAAAIRGGWSHALEDADAPPNRRALLFMAAGLGANLALIAPFGFTVAASAQFVLVAQAFGSRSLGRDLLAAPVLCLLAWLLFVEGLGVNIGAGVAEEALMRLLGRDAP